MISIIINNNSILLKKKLFFKTLYLILNLDKLLFNSFIYLIHTNDQKKGTIQYLFIYLIRKRKQFK